MSNTEWGVGDASTKRVIRRAGVTGPGDICGESKSKNVKPPGTKSKSRLIDGFHLLGMRVFRSKFARWRSSLTTNRQEYIYSIA
jgi:hypothetical protein